MASAKSLESVVQKLAPLASKVSKDLNPFYDLKDVNSLGSYLKSSPKYVARGAAYGAVLGAVFGALTVGVYTPLILPFAYAGAIADFSQYSARYAYKSMMAPLFNKVGSYIKSYFTRKPAPA